MMILKYFLHHTALFLTVVALGAESVDPRFFPGVEELSDATLRLHGLSVLYPGHVLFEDPQLEPADRSQRAARTEDLPRGVRYIRLYRLEDAFPRIADHIDHAALIVDFRYVRSNETAFGLLHLFALEENARQITALGTLPETFEAPAPGTERATRESPIVILCNRETAGPFEAVLAKLQQAGMVIAVGEHTAGRTGFYETAEPGIWTLNGEIRPDPKRSLVGTGLQPRIQVSLNAESHYRSYHLYEAGTPVERLLRPSTPDLATESDAGDEAPTDGDPVLQRGVEIVAALQVLRQLPDS